MNSAAVLGKLVRAEYALASAPLRVLDRAAARHLRMDSTLRIIVQTGVDALDSAAERWLGRPTLAASRHDDPEDDSPNIPTANANPHPPAPVGDRSDSEPRATGGVGAADGDEPNTDIPEPGHVQEVNRVAEDLLEELEEAPLVGELAESPEQEKERMAELRARHLVEEFEAEQRARHAKFQDS